MSYSYYDKNNKLIRINIEIGKEWKTYQTDNNSLNSIFDAVDADNDGKVSKEELDILQKLFNIADSQNEQTGNNKILENGELDLLAENIKNYKLGEMKNNLSETNKTPENINIPEDKFENYEYLKTAIVNGYNKVIKAKVDYSELDKLEKGKYYIKYWDFFYDKNTRVQTVIPRANKVLKSNQDGTKNWSEGINREISKIQIYSEINDETKNFLQKVGEEQGFEVEIIDASRWLEDYSVETADKKQLIPYFDNDFVKKLSKFSDTQKKIREARESITDGAQGAAAQGQKAKKYAANVAEEDLIQGKTYLEGGNVLNTLTKKGKPAAIIGEESIKYTMLAMGLEDTEESRKTAKAQIAKELGLEEKNITYIPQFDFHIDMHYRPLNDGQIGVPDYEEGIKFLDKYLKDIQEQKEALEEIPKDDGKGKMSDWLKYHSKVNSLHSKEIKYEKLKQQLTELNEKTKEIREKAEQSLKENGYKLVKVPCFYDIDKSNEPVNYMNGICGTSKKTGDKFYITNTSQDEVLDKYIENYLKKKVGFDKIYFAPTTEYLKCEGGIDCLTKEF